MNTLSLLDTEYTKTDLNEIFNEYPFELDTFQKWGIDKLHKNENILITAATGCGKTILAEYAIKKSTLNRKKCIYTSPIKSLSNQKFYEFKQKYPNLSIGIMTGDIKFNPDADVLILTTEILRNLLYKKQYDSQDIQYKLDLDINLETDVDCIIFDEVHYINDVDRGHVWEESLVLLPKHINLVLLSATINNAERLALWLQKIKNKPCHLIPKKERVIPLTHYMYHTSRYPKNIEISISKKINKHSNTLVELVNSKSVFSQEKYCKINEIKKLNYSISNNYNNNKVVISNLIKHLEKQKLLPCLFFIFSRKKCEEYAYLLDVCLNTPQEQAHVEKIFRQSIHKLHNKDVYLNSPEYFNLLQILKKGVGFHHSGLRTVFKEIIELLYSNGLIKVLFATESCAVGVNFPVKTVVFTALMKYSNTGKRYLTTSELLQMAGRAGRRGLDKTGTVIYLTNMMNMPEPVRIRNMICGQTENIHSKFNLSYQFILKILLNEQYTFDNFLQNTLLNDEFDEYKNGLVKQIEKQKIIIENLPKTNLTKKQYDEYFVAKDKINNKIKTTKNQKKNVKKVEGMENFKKDYQLYLANYEEYEKIDELHYKLNEEDNTKDDLFTILKYLESKTYITLTEDFTNLSKKNVNLKGILCSQLNECNELLMTEIITNNMFDDLNEYEIVGLLGLFCSTKCLSDDMRVVNVDILDIPVKLKNKIQSIVKMKDTLEEEENKLNIYMTTEWELNFDMVEYVYKFSKGVDYKYLEFDNYIGNFIKDVIKLDNLVLTLETLASIMNNNGLINKLQNIHELLIRDIVNTESLYIKL